MLFSRAASVTLERRSASAEWGNSDPPPPGRDFDGSAGINMTEGVALRIAAVYGSVDIIAKAVSSLKIEEFDSDSPTKVRLPPGPLIRRPYVEISRIDWLRQYVMSMALRGDFFGRVVERDALYYPTQIKPIHPDRASVRRITSGPNKGLPEYRFEGRLVPLDDVFHVRNLSVPGALRGLSPIAQLRTTLGLAHAQDLHGSAVFRNSALPLGVIEVEDDLDDDETLALARGWIAAHQGQAGLPGVLTGGAKFNPISISLEDLQFVESMKFSASVISGMIFHLPPHMLGMVDKSTSWGTGIAQQEQGLVTNTLMGYLNPLEEALTAVGPQDGRINLFNVKRRMRGDPLQRMQTAALGIASSILCPDEARADEDLPPIPDGLGKTFLVPINSQTIKQAVAETMAPGSTPQAPSPADE